MVTNLEMMIMCELPELFLVSEDQIQIWNERCDQISKIRANIRCGQVQGKLFVVFITKFAQLANRFKRRGEKKTAAVDQTRSGHVTVHIPIHMRRTELLGGAQKRNHRSVEAIVGVERQTDAGLEAVQFFGRFLN